MATRFLKILSNGSKIIEISSNGNKIFKNLVKWQQDDFLFSFFIVKYEREDGLDDSAGVKGQCSVFLKNGYELNGYWRNGKRHGNGLICGQPLESKGVKVIWGKYVGKCTNICFVFVFF